MSERKWTREELFEVNDAAQVLLDRNVALEAENKRLRSALDACETILSPVMADHQCFDAPFQGGRCNECLGCARWATWNTAKVALEGTAEKA